MGIVRGLRKKAVALLLSSDRLHEPGQALVDQSLLLWDIPYYTPSGVNRSFDYDAFLLTVSCAGLPAPFAHDARELVSGRQ